MLSTMPVYLIPAEIRREKNAQINFRGHRLFGVRVQHCRTADRLQDHSWNDLVPAPQRQGVWRKG